jgi:hypothetical protein
LLLLYRNRLNLTISIFPSGSDILFFIIII